MKKLVLLIALFWAIANAFFALEPHLEVTALDSVAIPYEYDYVMQLPNGDLQFYKLNYGTSSIQFYGFQYLSQTNEITIQENLGTSTVLDGLYPMRRYTLERFGNYYLVHKLVSGLAVFKLDQGTLTSRIINEFSFDQYFFLNQMTEIVSEDAMAIALADSLVYYNFIDGSSETLLQGAEYQCTTQIPIVISLPDSYFVYIKDQLSVSADPEEWTIFGSDGNLLFTQISTDPILLINYIGKSSGSGTDKIHGRWYTPAIASDSRTFSYECSFFEPDSLHIYFVGTPGSSMHESALHFFPFSDNRILRMYYDDFFESVFMYCNYVPLEQFPEVIFTFNWGNSYPVLTAISEDITTMTVRLPDQIAILTLWTYDFPAVHEFYFPASTNTSTVCTTFTYNNNLRLLNNQKIYSYHVAVSSEVADEVNSCSAVELQAYPNPVRSGEQLAISSNTKQPLMLDIYNIKGQKMRSLAMDKSGKISWDLLGDDGAAVASGIYILKPRNASSSKPTKIIILK